MKKLILPVLLAAAMLTGCQSFSGEQEKIPEVHLIALNYDAVEALIKNLKEPLVYKRPVIVATLVNVDVLTESSRFGRITSEQISAKLSNMGFSPVELKLRGDLFITQTAGELLLSREVREVSRSHAAQAVIVGTYAVANRKVYVNLKIVDADGNKIIAAHDYVVPTDDNTRAMLRTRQ